MEDDLIVTCPRCEHTHTIRLTEADLGKLRKNSGEDRTYKLSEVEKLLGLKRRTIKQLIYDGRLKAKKASDGPTSPWMVSAAAIAEYRRNR